RVAGHYAFKRLLAGSRPHFMVTSRDVVPMPFRPPDYLLEPCAERRCEALRVALDDAGNRAANVAGELVIPIDPPEPLHPEKVFPGLVDHDPTHPAEWMPKHVVPTRLLMPVACQHQVVLKAKALQTARNGSEELLQDRTLRFSEVRASVWHFGNL